jgi:hypothetical protein
MDPYIESRALWSDFHNALASQIRAQLNATIQPNYFARMTPHVTYDVIEVNAMQPYGSPLSQKTQGIYPDVSIWGNKTPASGGVMIAQPIITPAPVESKVKLEVPLRLYSIEIRDVESKGLVTVIEILSPVNKQQGHESYKSYLRKRRDLLRSEVHLMEIDLLRGGKRPPLETEVPPAPYYVTLSRADHRPIVSVWPIQLTDSLPILPVPLLDPDPDVSFDLGRAVKTVYEESAYGLEINYQQPPPPPALTDEESRWLQKLLHETTHEK